MRTIKQNWVYVLFVFAIIFFVVRMTTRSHHPGEIKISLKTIQTPAGWGYDVYTNDSIYIHQEFIPALAGRKGFINETEAEKIGELVLTRMKKSKLPVITLNDLDSLHITR